MFRQMIVCLRIGESLLYPFLFCPSLDKNYDIKVLDGKVVQSHSLISQSLCQVLDTRIMSSIFLLFMKKITEKLYQARSLTTMENGHIWPSGDIQPLPSFLGDDAWQIFWTTGRNNKHNIFNILTGGLRRQGLNPIPEMA